MSSLWAVVNFNSNRTCQVCTGLPDNSVYWPDPMTIFVQYVALTRLTYDRGQFSWHCLVGGLTNNHDKSHGAFRLFTVPGLILDLFDRPQWLSPPCLIKNEWGFQVSDFEYWFCRFLFIETKEKICLWRRTLPSFISLILDSNTLFYLKLWYWDRGNIPSPSSKTSTFST